MKIHKTFATSKGTFLAEVTQVNEFAFCVCTISPTFHATSQLGVSFVRFKTDSLGHVTHKLLTGTQRRRPAANPPRR